MMEKNDLRDAECDLIREDLSAYLDGELDAADAERVRNHLNNCKECAELFKRLGAVSEIIGEAYTEIPEELHTSIMNALNSHKAVSSEKKNGRSFNSRIRKVGLWCGAGVAAVVCLVMVGTPLFRSGFGADMAKSMSNGAADYEVEAYDLVDNGAKSADNVIADYDPMVTAVPYDSYKENIAEAEDMYSEEYDRDTDGNYYLDREENEVPMAVGSVSPETYDVTSVAESVTSIEKVDYIEHPLGEELLELILEWDPMFLLRWSGASNIDEELLNRLAFYPERGSLDLIE